MKNKSTILKYLSSYRSHSIILKNFLIITAVIIIPIALLFLNMYTSTRENLKDNIEKMSSPYLTSMVNSLDDTYSQMRFLTHTLANDSNVFAFVSETNPDRLDSLNLNLKSIIGAPILTYRYIDSIYVYSDFNGYLLSNNYSNKLDAFLDRSWLEQIGTLTRGEVSVVPRKYQDNYPYYLSFITTIFTELDKRVGTIVVNVDIEALAGSIIKTEDNDIEIYVLNDIKNLIFSNQTKELYETFDNYEFVYNRLEHAKNNSSEYSVYTTKSTSSGLEYISIMPLADKNIGKFPILKMTLLIIFLLLTSFAAAFFLAVRTFRPIGSIMTAFDLPNQVENSAVNDEIKYIIDNINKTIKEKHNAQIALEERLQLLNDAYNSALQAQINPHFLYNTLETINFLAYEAFSGANEISLITTNLSQMLRIGLDSEIKIIPFSKELEHLTLYIGILEARYKKQCIFRLSIEPNTLELKVIKLLLQPIVENAFNHGIRPKNGQGEIVISSEANHLGELIINISDNGVGMTREALQNIQNILRGDVYLSPHHIGMNNVNRRIKMMYGEMYGLCVDSSENVGTTVMIKLPITR